MEIRFSFAISGRDCLALMNFKTAASEKFPPVWHSKTSRAAAMQSGWPVGCVRSFKKISPMKSTGVGDQGVGPKDGADLMEEDLLEDVYWKLMCR